MLNTVYANAPQFQDLINAIQGGDTTAIATALGQIKTSIDSITTELGNLSTDVIQDATQWSDLITAIGSGGGGNVSIDSTQWTNLLTSVDKGDTSALATALGQIKTSIDSITTELGNLSTDITQDATQWSDLITAIGSGGGNVSIDSTQWSNLLTEIAKGDTTSVITALGNINSALGNIYSVLGSLSINPTQWGNLITTLSTQRLILQDSTQWASLVNAISNQSITVDLLNITSDVVSNESTVTPADTVTEALDVLKSDLSKFNILVENYTVTTDTNGNAAIEGYYNVKIINFAWNGLYIFIPFFYNNKWYCRVQHTDSAGTAVRNTSVTFNFYYTQMQ